jgi:hypothetical protein
VPALALAVDAVVQAEDPERVLLDLARQVLGDDDLELGCVCELCGVDLALSHGLLRSDGMNPKLPRQTLTNPMSQVRGSPLQ